MSGAYEKVTDLDEFELPWNKFMKLQELVYEGGMEFLRLRIREGRRFTDLELTPDDAQKIARALNEWAGEK